MSGGVHLRIGEMWTCTVCIYDLGLQLVEKARPQFPLAATIKERRRIRNVKRLVVPNGSSWIL